MSASQKKSDFQVATHDSRPFFEQALHHGVKKGLISDQKLQAMNVEAPKGIVQIAQAFGSAYLRDELELARQRMVNLVSLYLIDASESDLDRAAGLIRDNTFLTLSRNGSSMLKELFALPEYPIMGPFDQGRVEDFLDYWSKKKTYQDYRDAKRQRLQHQSEIRLAKKLGAQMGLSNSTFQEQHCEADGILRSAILLRLQKKTARTLATQANDTSFDMVGFAELLEALRSKGTVKNITWPVELSDAEQQLLETLHREIESFDLPKISDEKISLDVLIAQLKDRYFIKVSEIEDTARYDALVSKEWSKVTKGKSDIDAVLTMLLCIAADVPAKTSLTEAAAKTLVKKLRKDGFKPEVAEQFIEQHAPHEKQESLLEDWQDFCEQAALYLLDDWDHDFKAALKFLNENCYIEKVAKRTTKTKAQ